MDKQSMLGNNDIDDVRWLCSLTEFELDLSMGLKNLVRLRAKKIGHEDLAEKFDLKMLRTLSFYFMENLEGRLKDLLGPTGFGSNILNHKLSDDFGSMITIEDLYPFICYDKRKRIADMTCLQIESRRPATEGSLRLRRVVTTNQPLKPRISSCRSL